tara:strand:- start:174 stop:281 length:108 start_codon:yes stop_codon:yes gene_type:complete
MLGGSTVILRPSPRTEPMEAVSNVGWKGIEFLSMS